MRSGKISFIDKKITLFGHTVPWHQKLARLLIKAFIPAGGRYVRPMILETYEPMM
jgi:hypothetical protein